MPMNAMMLVNSSLLYLSLFIIQCNCEKSVRQSSNTRHTTKNVIPRGLNHPQRKTDEVEIISLKNVTDVMYLNEQMQQFLYYDVSTEIKPSDIINVTMLNSGCSSAPTDDAITVVNKTAHTSNNTNDIMVSLGINMKNIEDSELYNKVSDHLAGLTFCVKTDFIQVKETSTTTTTLSSSIETNLFITLDLNQKDPTYLKSYTNVNKDAKACLCDHNFSCLSKNLLSKSSEFQICVVSQSYQKVALYDLSFRQDGITKFHAIKNGILTDQSRFLDKFVSKIGFHHHEMISLDVFRTYMLSAFYTSKHPTPITVHGVAKLSKEVGEGRYLKEQVRGHEEDAHPSKFVMLIDLKPPTYDENAFWKALLLYASIINISVLILVATANFIAKKNNIIPMKKDTVSSSRLKKQLAGIDDSSSSTVNARLMNRNVSVASMESNGDEGDDEGLVGQNRDSFAHNRCASVMAIPKSKMDEGQEAEFVTKLDLL